MLDSMLVPVSRPLLQRRSPLVAERLVELPLRAFSLSLFPEVQLQPRNLAVTKASQTQTRELVGAGWRRSCAQRLQNR